MSDILCRSLCFECCMLNVVAKAVLHMQESQLVSDLAGDAQAYIPSLKFQVSIQSSYMCSMKACGLFSVLTPCSYLAAWQQESAIGIRQSPPPSTDHRSPG